MKGLTRGNKMNEINSSSSILQRSLALSMDEQMRAIVKISAGKKTDSIENAAEQMIADQAEIQASGAAQASQNVQDGLNMLQTAEGDLGGINDNLQKIRELSLQASNGTYGDKEKEAIRSQIESLTGEIDRISKTSSFNGKALLDGSNSGLTIQSGGNSGSDNQVQIDDPLSSASASALGLPTGDDLKTAISNGGMLDKVDEALKTVSQRRSSIGAISNTLEGSINSLSIRHENMSAVESRIRDVDVAAETSKLTQNQILSSSSAALLAQANQSPANAITLL